MIEARKITTVKTIASRMEKPNPCEQATISPRAYLKEARHALGLTRKQAGERLGIPSGYDMLEAGTAFNPLSIYMAQRIKKGLGLSIQKIAEGEAARERAAKLAIMLQQASRAALERYWPKLELIAQAAVLETKLHIQPAPKEENKNPLLWELVAQDVTIEETCAAAGMSIPDFMEALKNGNDFTLIQAEQISNFLTLDNPARARIFLKK